MYSDKRNIQQLVALLEAYSIRQVVLCPGSRNSPVVHTIAIHPSFQCHSIADERSAGFFALGLALNSKTPTAIVCTSGTALLNIHPAVAEAFYQQIPLVVISADRPEAWIGQMDGQTIPQPNVFHTLVKKSVNLPEVKSDEDEWYCNRLINEALLETDHRGKGPVHINIQLEEPLFHFNTPTLPRVRKINRKTVYDKHPTLDIPEYTKKMIICGQMLPKEIDLTFYEEEFVILSEHPGNQYNEHYCFDAVLAAASEEEKKELRPDLLITLGGHIVSKRLKNFIRQYPPKEHWHICEDGKVYDTFSCLTTIVEASPVAALPMCLPGKSTGKQYLSLWKKKIKAITLPEYPYSEARAVQLLLENIPSDAVLHLANSSAVRYAQLFPLPNGVEVHCNRGTSGIEGSLSTAVGYASLSDKINYLIIGDLSFFYDMNALWIQPFPSNLRILLLNNGGGKIFQSIPGFNTSPDTLKYIAGNHTTSAEGWATERKLQYTRVTNEHELRNALIPFFANECPQPLLMEVFPSEQDNK